MKFKLNWIIVSIFVAAYLLSISNPLFSMEHNESPDMELDMSSGPEPSGVADYSDIDTLDDQLLQSMEIEDWVNRPMLSKDFFYLANKFVQNASNTYMHSPWLYNKPINTQIKKILEWNFGEETELKTSEFPCIAKLIVPQNTRVEIIGDIHGEMDTMEAIFHSLKNKNLINEFMYMPDNARIIFLGDYTDRGNFNLQVLASALILSAKNPDKVFLLKGNHEFDISRQNSEIINEIGKITTNEKARNILISNAIKVYELMSVGMFLGFEGPKQTPFHFIAHGGPDIRYDYNDFLNLQDKRLCFWMLTGDDILKTTKTRELFEKIYLGIKQSKEACSALELHTHELLAYGFLWNDIIDFACVFPVFKSHRGEQCIALNARFIQHFLESFTNENVKIVGLIRGHQHHLAKKIGSIPDGKILSPSCCYFTGNPAQWHILKSGTPKFLNNTFSIVTVISGQIQEEAKIIQYLPTFLELRFLENGTHRIEAIEYNI